MATAIRELNSESVDMWAAGCVLYTILCGYQPFFKQYVADLIETIKRGTYEFDSEIWSYISAEAKQLIGSLLCVDPEKRISPANALQHGWFNEYKPPNAEESRDSRLIMQNNLRINKRRLTRHFNEDDLEDIMPKRLSFNKAVKSKLLDDSFSKSSSSSESGDD